MNLNYKKHFLFYSGTFILISIAACTIDISGGDAIFDLSFKTPSNTTYISDSSYEIAWKNNLIESENPEIGFYNIEIYNDSSCGELLIPDSSAPQQNIKRITKKMKTDQSSLNIKDLKDGDIITAKVFYTGNEKTIESPCSSKIIIDKQTPDDIHFINPSSDLYITQTEYDLRFQPSQDNGQSGLAEETYTVKVFNQPNCSGSLVNEQKSASPQIQMEQLENNVFYSVEVQAFDKAGNRSNKVCSNYIEIDTDIPSIQLTDPSSSNSYSRTPVVDVQLSNIDSSSYFCITEDTSFNPINTTSPCPGGSGPINGWHSTPPSQITLSAGEETKDIRIWVADNSGELFTKRPGTESITFDTTPVNNMTIIGVGGDQDSNLDEWLYTTTTPTIYFTTSDSPDAFRYDIEIQDSLSQIACPLQSIFHPNNQIYFEGCNLTDGENYTALLTGYDRALNPTTVTFNFTVDLTPPTDFSISGVHGGLDTIIDNFSGISLPHINYTDADGEDLYLIQIINDSDQVICSQEQEPQNFVEHNFGASPSGTCQSFISGQNYFVIVLAKDHAGNETPALNQNFSFTADLDNPQINLTTVLPPLTTSTSAQFDFTADDLLSGISLIECRLNSNSFTSCSSPQNISGLSEGSHQYDVRATDRVGNSLTSSFHWNVDLTPPALSVQSSPATNTNQSLSSVYFSATDLFGINFYECNFQSGGWNTCTSPWSQTLPDGTYNLQIRASDNVARLSNIENLNWSIDTIPPTLSYSGAAPTNIVSNNSSGNISIDFISADNTAISTRECQWDGGPYTSCSTPATQSGLGAGSHTLTVRITDIAGNSTTLSHIFNVVTHYWQTSVWGSCSANPYWSSWGSCNASPYWGSWSSCSANCGGGSQSRSCYNTSGTQSRSCLGTSGSQSRSLICIQNNGSTTTTTSHANCLDSPPSTSQSCSSYCSGSSSQACSSGCSGSSVQSCNTFSCVVGSASCSEYICSNPAPGYNGPTCGPNPPNCPSTWSYSGSASYGGCSSGSLRVTSMGAAGMTGYVCEISP